MSGGLDNCDRNEGAFSEGILPTRLACGLVQSLAAGYFVWDLGTSVRYYRIFGPGILAHAITALSVYLFGFVSIGWESSITG